MYPLVRKFGWREIGRNSDYFALQPLPTNNIAPANPQSHHCPPTLLRLPTHQRLPIDRVSGLVSFFLPCSLLIFISFHLRFPSSYFHLRNFSMSCLIFLFLLNCPLLWSFFSFCFSLDAFTHERKGNWNEEHYVHCDVKKILVACFATFHPALSVRPSVGPSTFFLLFWGFFGVTAPAQLLK